MRKPILFAAIAIVLSASVAAAAEVGVPNRLATAKVGEWASYRVPNGYIQKLTVIKRDGTGPTAAVTIRVDNIYNGQVVSSSEITRDAGDPLEPPRLPEGDVKSVEIKVKPVAVMNRTINATVIEIETADNGDDDEVEWYLSADIPVFGIIKQVVDDKSVFELVEFGDQ